MSFTDKTLDCRDCGQEFTWTAGEQEFYQAKGLANPPARCKPCRGARRAQQGETAGPSGDRPTFRATCSGCGQEAHLPFQPRSDKPVYCSSCFAARR